MKNRYLIIGADLSGEKIGDKQKSAINQRTKKAILDFMRGRGYVKASEISKAINLKSSRTRDYLAEMTKEGLIEAQGANRNRVYILKK